MEFSVSTLQILPCDGLLDGIRTQAKIVSFFSPNTRVNSIKQVIVTYVGKNEETTLLTGFSSLFSLVFINEKKV